MTKDVEPETLDFILDYTKTAPERQLHDAEMLDAKMVQIFSAASIVIGLVGFSRLAAPAPEVKPTQLLVVLALIFALVAYIATFACALIQLWIRKFRRSAQADGLWSKYWDKTVPTIKHSLVQDISDTYKFNDKLLKGKACTVNAGLIATFLEVLAVGFALVKSLRI